MNAFATEHTLYYTLDFKYINEIAKIDDAL